MGAIAMPLTCWLIIDSMTAICASTSFSLAPWPVMTSTLGLASSH